MENKINIAELLKDCPQGMELDCTMFENVTFIGVGDIEKQFPIEIKIGGNKTKYLTKTGCFHDDTLVPEAKCVIFPKGKTTWEGFVPPYQFKDGDILTYTSTHTTTFIYRNKDNEPNFSTSFYVACNNAPSHNFLIYNKYTLIALNENCEVRLATEEEKAKLFQAIKDNGYHWDDETKTLEKLIEPIFKVGDRIRHVSNSISGIIIKIIDIGYYIERLDGKGISYINFEREKDYELVPKKFDITTLKPFDKVLVRQTSGQVWTAHLFSHVVNANRGLPISYVCVGGHSPIMCIPYENNEHLLGTSIDCDEFYKTWKE